MGGGPCGPEPHEPPRPLRGRKADVNRGNSKGITPLMRAAMCNHAAIVEPGARRRRRRRRTQNQPCAPGYWYRWVGFVPDAAG